MTTVSCSYCEGDGVYGEYGAGIMTTKTCHICGGSGAVNIAPGAVRCGPCRGRGWTVESRGTGFEMLPNPRRDCYHCSGTGWTGG